MPPRRTRTTSNSAATGSSASNSLTTNQTVALADLGNALLYCFIVPFGPLFLDRRLNVGFYRASDTAWWWALVLLAFVGGQRTACWMRRRPTSWHLYMNRPPQRRARRLQFGCLAGLLVAVVATGLVTRLEYLVVVRFATGFFSSFLWGNSERMRRAAGVGSSSSSLGLSGRWSNNRILPAAGGAAGRGAVSLGEEGPLVNPMAAIGMAVGGLVGGVAFPTRTYAVLHGRPALLPAVVIAVCVFFLGCLVLRRMNKELATVGGRKHGGGSEATTAASHDDNGVTASPSSTRRSHATKSLGNSSSSLSSSVSIDMRQVERDAASSSSSLPAVPATFLKACGGNLRKAQAKYQDHLAWRAREGVDTIHDRPHPHFAACKEHYPHWVHGRSRKGEIVIYEFPGQLAIHKLKAMGIRQKDIGYHYMYFNEFLYKNLSHGDDGRAMTGTYLSSHPPTHPPTMPPTHPPNPPTSVLDISGVGITTLTKDVLDCLRTTGDILSNHYPERVTRICVVNVPFFVGGLWRILASVLPASLQDRIELSANPAQDLLKYIAPEELPTQYGGTSPLPLGQSKDEVALRELVARVGNGGGKESNPETPSRPLPAAAAPAQPPTLPSSSSSSSSPPTNESSSGWLSSWLPGGPRRTPPPKQAHLGYENRFHFDPVRKMWILEEKEEEEEEGKPLLAHTPAEEEEEEEEDDDEPLLPATEEDGLVLAIQAAHFAERLTREGKKSPSSSAASASLPAPQPLALQMEHDPEWGAAASSSTGTHPPSSSQTPPEPTMLPKMTLTFFSLSLFQHALLAMLPLWLMGSHTSGGLGIKPLPTSLLLALGALATLAYHTYAPPLLLRLPWASPLRAFRLAVVAFVTATVLLGLHPRMTHPPSSSSFGTGLQHTLAGLFYTIVLTVLLSALAFGRAAASVLLDIVSRAHLPHHPPPSFLHRHPLLPLLATLGELMGPLVGASIYAWSLLAEMPFPMDTRLLFHVVALVMVGLYVLTLQLNVVQSGDWGVVGVEESGGGSQLFFVKRGGKKGRRKARR